MQGKRLTRFYSQITAAAAGSEEFHSSHVYYPLHMSPWPWEVSHSRAWAGGGFTLSRRDPPGPGTPIRRDKWCDHTSDHMDRPKKATWDNLAVAVASTMILHD